MHARNLLLMALVATPVPLLAQPVSGSPSDTTSEHLWRAYANDLSTYLIGTNADTHALHILTVMEVIDSSDDQGGNYDRIVNWCEPIPEYSPIYNRSGRSVSGSYGNYLSSLAHPDVPNDRKENIARLRKEYLDKTGKANALAMQVGKEWERFSTSEKSKPEDRRTSYDVWYASEWGMKEGAAQADVAVAASAWAQALSSAYGGYQGVSQAILDYENLGFKVEGKSQSGLMKRLPSCSLGSASALQSFIRDGEANVSSGKYAFETTLTTDSGQKTVDKWQVSARGGFGGYFGGRAKGERTKISEDQRKFSMVVRFRNLSRLAINRDWYRPDIVAVVNEDRQFVRNAIVNPNTLWGQNGVWRLTPTQIFVGYKPSINITFSTKDYDYAHTKWSAGAGFGIGAFWIGGRGSGSKEKTIWDYQTKTLTVEYDTNEVYAVALTSSFMPRSTATPSPVNSAITSQP